MEIGSKESINNKSVNNNDHQTVGRRGACAASRCATGGSGVNEHAANGLLTSCR